MENVALHGVKFNSRSKCKMLAWELGIDAKYSGRDYTESEYCEQETGLQSPGADSDDAAYADVTFDTLKINMGPGVFHGSTEFRRLIFTCWLCSIQYISDYSST